MQVTEIRIRLTGSRDDKLQAYCTVTFDRCFVVRDLKIIGGTKGAFVAMPSRKLTDPCPNCGAKNHLRARFCNECGSRLNPDRAELDERGRAKLYADIAHPISVGCREDLQRRILSAYEDELVRARSPGYQPPSDEFPDLGADHGDAAEAEEPRPRPLPPPPRTREGPPHRFGEGIFP